MQVSATVTGHRTIVTATGDLDVTVAPEFRAYLHRLVDDGAGSLVLDLSAVDFVDSTVLGVLVSVHKRLMERGAVLELVCPRDALLRIFRVTGLDRVFTIHRSPADAAR